MSSLFEQNVIGRSHRFSSSFVISLDSVNSGPVTPTVTPPAPPPAAPLPAPKPEAPSPADSRGEVEKRAQAERVCEAHERNCNWLDTFSSLERAPTTPLFYAAAPFAGIAAMAALAVVFARRRG